MRLGSVVLLASLLLPALWAPLALGQSQVAIDKGKVGSKSMSSIGEAPGGAACPSAGGMWQRHLANNGWGAQQGRRSARNIAQSQPSNLPPDDLQC